MARPKLRRLPKLWWWIRLAYLSGLLLAALGLLPLTPKHTVRERALATAVAFERARMEGDWNSVWARLAEDERERISLSLARWFFGSA